MQYISFDPHRRHRVVSLSKTHWSTPYVLVKTRKRWFRPDITEKLLTGKLSFKKCNIDLPSNEFDVNKLHLSESDFIFSDQA